MSKVMIVFEETDNAILKSPTFQVYLEGMTKERREEIDRMTPNEQLHKLTTSEFWALRCFQICGSLRKLTHMRYNHHVVSVLSRHDNTIDKRPGSNASFVVEDAVPWDEAKILASMKVYFPDCWERLCK